MVEIAEIYHAKGEPLMTTNMKWKKGRGKLGLLQPLLGTWIAEADSPLGRVRCTRTFQRVLADKYIQLNATWEMEQGTYEEIAYFGPLPDGIIGYWSFTSDGKQAQGQLADVTDISPQAIGFEAHVPAGLGRMAYWPDDESGFHWVVEAKTKKGWSRFTHHHYRHA
jgi:hypothetical protein